MAQEVRLSDTSETVVDLDASLEQAPELAEAIRDWLVGQGVIVPEISDATLGSTGGHRPGPNYKAAIKADVTAGAGLTERETAEWHQSLGTKVASDFLGQKLDTTGFLGLVTNGVAFEVGRRVFDTGENELELKCASCDAIVLPVAPYFDAIGEWYDGDELASYACPDCGSSSPVKEWRGPRAFGLGNLGIVFWNWPPLSEAFVDSLGRQLGHQTMLVRTKI